MSRAGSRALAALWVTISVGCAPRDPQLPGGQSSEPIRVGPADAPVVVGPGIISTDAIEHNASVSADGRTLYFTRSSGRWGDSGNRSHIYVSHHDGMGWGAPEPLPFSGDFDDSDASLSPDGDALLFVSTRPSPDGSGGGRDIWEYQLADTAEPRLRAVAHVNSTDDEFSPVLAASGTLYFASNRTGGIGQGDLYLARPTTRGFATPESLGPVVNSPFGEWNLVVSPDESLLVFEASGRALNRSIPGDLYLSLRDGEGWRPPVPLSALNTTGSDLMPKLSPDGATLYYASSGPTGGDHTDIFAAELAPLVTAAAQEPLDFLVAVSRSDHHVAVIDPQTLRVVRRLETGQGPHEVADLGGGRVVVANYGSFPTPHAEPVVAHPGFVNVPAGNTLTILDVVGTAQRVDIPLPNCRRSHGVLGSTDGTLVWTTCEEEGVVLEVDVVSHQVTRRWETGQTGAHRLVATKNDRFLVVANVAPGNVSVVDRHSGEVVTLETGQGSEGLAADAEGRVWVLASGDQTATRITPGSAAPAMSFPTGGVFPISVSLDEDRGEAWVAQMGPRSIDVFELPQGEQVARVTFETGPLRVLSDPRSRHVYVSLPRENAVAVVDRATRLVIGRVEGIMEVDGLVWIRVTK